MTAREIKDRSDPIPFDFLSVRKCLGLRLMSYRESREKYMLITIRRDYIGIDRVSSDRVTLIFPIYDCVSTTIRAGIAGVFRPRFFFFFVDIIRNCCNRTFCFTTNMEASQIAGVPVLKSPPWNQTITGHRSFWRLPTHTDYSLIIYEL